MKDTETKDESIASQSALHWRFEFDSYSETRHFLDQLAKLSKRESFYPNINFGKTYANVTIDAEGQTVLGARQTTFVEEMNAYAASGRA